ncbi:Carboxypeptidase C (cathepsin A) [Sphingobium sp. AP50]|nr:Carboxypeptidase C (cathepsin A) [Sphingobium sp. AP50]
MCRMLSASVAGIMLASPMAPLHATDKPAAQASEPVAEKRVVTSHVLTMAKGVKLPYSATVGTLQLKDKQGKPGASLFYVAYTVAPKAAERRPVTFFYNGGPGSSSIWLHMASFAPVRVPVDVGKQGGAMPRLAPNPDSLLDSTDMVFLDAVGTGYSRALDPQDSKHYWGNDQDAAAFMQAIRRYVEINNRWLSPKYLFGESYGTTRSAMLSYKLIDSGMPVDGVILMSSILNFAQRAPGLDRMDINYLPSYAATAWYHGKVDRGTGLDAHVARARQFAQGAYAAALAKGQDIGAEERESVIAQMASLTGLSPDYLRQADLHVPPDRFRKELLRDRSAVTGGFDTRFIGSEGDNAADTAQSDPADDAISGAIIANFSAYLAHDLGYASDGDYVVNTPALFPVWDWSHMPPGGPRQNAMANVAIDLGAAMRRAPRMRVLSLSGYYDLSTPFFATEFDLAHLYLPTELRPNLVSRHYASGHMLYLDGKTFTDVTRDVRGFIEAKLD